MHGVHTEARREINANLRKTSLRFARAVGHHTLVVARVEASTELSPPQTFRRRRLGCGGDHLALRSHTTSRASQHVTPSP